MTYVEWLNQLSAGGFWLTDECKQRLRGLCKRTEKICGFPLRNHSRHLRSCMDFKWDSKKWHRFRQDFMPDLISLVLILRRSLKKSIAKKDLSPLKIHTKPFTDHSAWLGRKRTVSTPTPNYTRSHALNVRRLTFQGEPQQTTCTHVNEDQGLFPTMLAWWLCSLWMGEGYQYLEGHFKNKGLLDTGFLPSEWIRGTWYSFAKKSLTNK